MFTQADWEEFYEAFDNGRATFIYSHLFPATNESDPKTMMPERDYWYEYTTDLDTQAPVQAKKVVLHVHYLGTLAEQDESRVALVNARWPNTAAHQFESHAMIQSEIMTTAKMFRVTAVKTAAKHKNDPTKWMAGGANQPPPWRWLDDSTREDGYVGATI